MSEMVFPDALLLAGGGFAYSWSVWKDGVEMPWTHRYGSRERFVVERRTWASLVATDDRLDFRWERQWRMPVWVDGCFWCGARPALWDQDCDGPYLTSSCGSPQCRG